MSTHKPFPQLWWTLWLLRTRPMEKTDPDGRSNQAVERGPWRPERANSFGAFSVHGMTEAQFLGSLRRIEHIKRLQAAGGLSDDPRIELIDG